MVTNLDEKCRLDKWLWAARFFKTRSLAADAVSGGKVRVNGDRAKSAKEVQLGMQIQITTKDMEMVIEVTGLSNTRRSATDATFLYKETKESKAKRDNIKTTRSNEHAERERGAGRPTKRQLREIAKFTGIKNYDGL
ncbi:MAG: RNA-binding S4 domain-containing protein [Methylophilaceae bacterium]|nr:MAG: RNA-binding S4 domain-containing protein [Methylophilaceae bacterium]